MSDEPIRPPEKLRSLAQWQLSKASTLGARLTASLMPAGGRSDFAVLAALEEHHKLSQAQLGRLLGLDRNDVNAIINRLEGEGHVERKTDPADRRRNVITSTAAGERLFVELQERAEQVSADLLHALTATERTHLRELLGRVLDSHREEPA
jgi:DNA-binding MarR family transcriptional regulator